MTARALPRIVSVGVSVYAGPRIAVHLAFDQEIAANVEGAVVAVQSDGFDEQTCRVWNVHVVGRVVSRDGADLMVEPGVVEGCWLAA